MPPALPTDAILNAESSIPVTMTDEDAFLIGNDPSFQTKQMQGALPTRDFCVVGTSTLGAVGLTLQIAKASEQKPHLVIVENSESVYEAWGVLKDFFKRPTDLVGTPQHIALKLLQYMKERRVIPCMDVYDDSSEEELLENVAGLIEEYGIDSVQSLVAETVVTRQSWLNFGYFKQLETALSEFDIVAYPSNIMHCLQSYVDALQLNKSVEALRAKFTCISNLDKGEPTKSAVVKSSAPRAIMTKMGPGPFYEHPPSFYLTSVQAAQRSSWLADKYNNALRKEEQTAATDSLDKPKPAR
jgi:hypothetical protein